MSSGNEEKKVVHIDNEEVQIREKIEVKDERWNKTRTLQFQELGDLNVLHYEDKKTGERVYVKYVKPENGLKINAYLTKEGKIVNIATQQPIQNTPQ